MANGNDPANGKFKEAKEKLFKELKAQYPDLKGSILETTHKADVSIEKRIVYRNGMIDHSIHELRIPRSIDQARKMFKDEEILRLAMASYRTEQDDQQEKLHKEVDPAKAEQRAISQALKSAPADKIAEAKKILGIT